MVEVEFIEDTRDGKPKLLDVNTRPFGWHALCIASGLDLPWMQYGHAVGRRPSRVVPQYGRRWIRLLTDVPAGAQLIRGGHMSPVHYIRSLRGKNVFSVLDRNDPLPAAGDMAVAGLRLVKAMARRRGPRTFAARPDATRLGSSRTANIGGAPPA
jgi:predicted ATP-grasp superfamily ATP-dependent carboligase